MSRNLVFSRNFTISKPKNKVNYVLLGGPNFRTGGPAAHCHTISCESDIHTGGYFIARIDTRIPS